MDHDRLRCLLRGHPDVLNEIRRRVSLNAAGKHFRCACPRHEDSTFPLYVHPYRGLFTCFGCGFTGDLVDLIAELDQVPVADAMAALQEMLRIDVEAQPEGAPDPESTSGALAMLPADVDLVRMARELNTTPERLREALVASRTEATTTETATKRASEAPTRPTRSSEEREKEMAAIVSLDNLRLACRKVKRFATEHDVYFDAQMFGLWEQHLEANLYLLRERLRCLASKAEASR